MNKKILIYIEKNSTSELVLKGAELASKRGNTEVIGVVIGEKPEGKSYFDKIYYDDRNQLKEYSSELYLTLLFNLVKDISPDIILFSATTEGRTLAPLLAAKLHTGLTADCIELDINEQDKLEATRPTFGGKLMATIISKTSPQMATIRPRAITTKFNATIKDTEYINFSYDSDFANKKIKLIKTIRKEITNNLDKAEIVVAGGKGIKDNINLVYNLAKAINGQAAFSRAIVDLGLANQSFQIGQTGKTIAPKLYIACGISGAIQHTVGIMNAKKIIAINTDKNAPIFKLADIGIVGDAKEIIPNIINHLNQDA
jgi:electron transfer flavoprotein alpha subunit